MTIDKLYSDFYDNFSNKDNALFNNRLIKSKYTIVGVKVYDIESFAKTLLKKGYIFNDLPLHFHEDILVAGFFIAHANLTADDKINCLSFLLDYIDNWATCDMIACRMKNMTKNNQFFYSLLSSNHSFKIRFAIVWLKCFLLKQDLEKVLNALLEIKNNNYFVKMAIAWTFAEGFVYDFNKTLDILKKCNDSFIICKSVQKCCDSFRIPCQVKLSLKNLKIDLLKGSNDVI